MGVSSAHEAFERLKQGNERFAFGRSEGPGAISSRRAQFAGHQEPFAIILSCSDSRVPPEMVFDTSLGDLFVIRVAGNVANPSSIASIEYAVANLGTKLIVVMAHQSCGAVAAAIEGGDLSPSLNHLVSFVQAAVGPSGQEPDDVARRNARINAERLVSESDTIRAAVDRDEVRIVSAFYGFDDGVVRFDN